MAWVKSEYAGELAVLSTWLVALAPWSASVFEVSGLTVVALRFLPFRFQFIFGATLPNERPFLWAWQVADFQSAAGLSLAGDLGFAALVVFAFPFALSLYYYFEEERVAAALPADPVRLFGGLLGLVALLTLAATALFFRYFPGTTLPVGAAVAAVLAYLLLTIDRT
ncbi:TIGR04206 family protein [Haloarcula nitratireducens]|uniref:TIGR04206 family protein n=1 Tax=Haloarcula nitratireducens TaxID=2487749 RepID=A0AAW4P888_9EURY|nr:TIGR04206 family protein [Halomicroarcula nitratireducens]MBX0293977.1 TIGR04206 family protein [Halomicroarcula nitratireducens]